MALVTISASRSNGAVPVAIAGSLTSRCGCKGNAASIGPIGIATGLGCPEFYGIWHVTWQGKILVAEGVHGCVIAAHIGTDAAQLCCTDKRLPRKNTACQQAKDDQYDGKFNKGKAALHAAIVMEVR